MSGLERAARSYQRAALAVENAYRLGGIPTKTQREALTDTIDELLAEALLLPPE